MYFEKEWNLYRLKNAAKISASFHMQFMLLTEMFEEELVFCVHKSVRYNCIRSALYTTTTVLSCKHIFHHSHFGSCIHTWPIHCKFLRP